MFFEYYNEIIEPGDLRLNKLQIEDRAFHDWYRFVLSFPPHLVRNYIEKFELDANATVLDPFCGTGTTLVEAKKLGLNSFGIEANPVLHLASSVKTNWDIEYRKLIKHASLLYERCLNRSIDLDLFGLDPDQEKLILENSISPIPLHKCLVLYNEIIKNRNNGIRDVELLALANTSVHVASNLKFGPEVGVRKIQKEDANVYEEWYKKILQIAADIKNYNKYGLADSKCFLDDSRCISNILQKNSIDAVITSPPYPNEKDYTRTTRLESVLLEFIKNKSDLRSLKQKLIRSNTRNVYISDDDDKFILNHAQILDLSKEIERRRLALNKNSGFEKLYHKVTRLYFGGMKRHLEDVKLVLKPGAKLAYVVGDQASYLQVLIRTGELLADIADSIGYNVTNIDLFRTRVSTSTGFQLREEVVVLEWKGDRKMNSNNINRYDQLIEKIFFRHYEKGNAEVAFDREEFESTAGELGIKLPKNLGDIIYSYRYRSNLPVKITKLLREGEEWIIRSVGKGKYVFAKSTIHKIASNPRLSQIKILDSTPEIIKRYALNDEQALLAMLRYNRLIDIFSGATCYSLQSHLRTTVPNIGQVETDELYVGVNKSGAQFIFSIQAKGKTDQIGVVQIEQDFALCRSKFPDLICRPLAAQFIDSDVIALFEFEESDTGITIKEERHYKIVPNDLLSDKEIAKYKEDL